MHDAQGPTKLCYLAGVMKRCGTNYLARLIRCHQNCYSMGPIWEDFLLTESDRLVEYVQDVSKNWNQDWGVEEKLGGNNALLKYLGSGLKSYLLSQNSSIIRRIQAQEEGVEYNSRPASIFLTKTPSVKGLQNYFKLFPGSYLILLIRDGRAVVESGVKTFGWNYHESIDEWVKAADTLYEVYQEGLSSGKPVMLVRYEDLIVNRLGTINEIVQFLNLREDKFNYEEAEQLGVFGSSVNGSPDLKNYWREVKKDESFDPLNRSRNWSDELVDKFQQKAESTMLNFGYQI